MSILLESYESAKELLERARVSDGGIMVVGCSTSEVCGGVIGKNSSPEAAGEILAGILKAAGEFGVNVAAQCCEHLNRAVVVSRSAVEVLLQCGVLVEVNVIPQPKAGGSFATALYKALPDAIVVERIKADCGMDIGGVLIGMQLKEVAVPVHLEHRCIGAAGVIGARVRRKYVGGSRAVYGEDY